MSRFCFVDDREIAFQSVVFVHVASLTLLHIHKAECFCSVCVTVMLTASAVLTLLVQYAVVLDTLKLDIGFQAISYVNEIPSSTYGTAVSA